jgi:steroid delta-isomerase-like uncharacterized protein
MAHTKSTRARVAKKAPSRAAKKPAAVDTTADAKPARRRISRRKQVEQHARSYFDAIDRRDVRALTELWSENGVDDIVPLGAFRGRDQIADLFRELFAAVPDLKTTITRIVPGEREAAVEWRMTGHFTGMPFQGVEATGGRVDMRGFDLLAVEDGKVASNTAYYDGMSFARQIGLMPAQDSAPERAMKGALNAATKLRRTMRAKARTRQVGR